MAVVKPFRGVCYDPQPIEDMQSVVSQPYDKIDDVFQQRYYDLSPYNVVRIILGKAEPGDRPVQPEGPNVYTRARAFYQQWLREGILVREERPAFYAYEQTFTVSGMPYTRLGLIAAVELTDFDQGVILPHERTHSGPKEDRLRLLKTIQASTEQIFILYPDPENRVNALLQRACGARQPDIDVFEILENDVRQRVWRVTDSAVVDAIQSEMAPKRGLIIADGHHRYGTGLTYRDMQREKHPGAPADAAFNFVQATLVSMNDTGLVILPTHREICNFTSARPVAILERARAHFAVAPARDLAECLSAVNAHPTGHAFGFYGGPETGYHVLTLKDGQPVDHLISDDHSPDWKSLAVSILHRVLLEQIAGVPAEGIEDKSMIRYHRDAQQAVDSVAQGLGNFVFFVSATRMDQIKACAAHGETMPQKSTDFYPKMISGLSILPLGPDERL
ncbi:MAG TPA: DUF1015 domain-containing protein [Aggregatilineaceae bacterium]|nr:DUF1015 domain-containing protein [Aggregatilineaceae bacterium]